MYSDLGSVIKNKLQTYRYNSNTVIVVDNIRIWICKEKNV